MNHLIEELQQWPYWVCRNQDKRPYIAETARLIPARPNAPEECGRTYEAARKAAEIVEAFTGVGFIMGPSLGLVCIDLDHCIEGEKLNAFAAAIVSMIDQAGGTYIEYSPSHSGLHVWGRGVLPGGKGIKKKDRAIDIELYQGGRYMTVTGEPWEGHNIPLGNIQAAIDGIIEKYDLLKKQPPQRGPTGQPGAALYVGQVVDTRENAPAGAAAPASLDDDFLIEKARNSKKGEKFSALFDRGDMAEHGNDHNRADAALLSILAYWTNGNKEQMARIFLQSKLAEDIGRKKGHERDYLYKRSIPAALAYWEQNGRPHYDPANVMKLSFPTSLLSPDGAVTAAGGITLELTPALFTDSAQADLVMKLYGNRLKYADDLKTWVHFTGKRWEVAAEIATTYRYARGALDLIKRWIEQEMTNTPGESPRYKELAAYQGKLLRRYDEPKLRQAMKIAAGLCPVKSTDFDRFPYLLNCDNCVLDLEHGRKYPHEPGKLLMKNTGVAYTGKYHSSLWKDTVAAVLPDPDTREYMHKVLGYALTADVSRQEFYFLKGSGGNGKGIILETVAAAMGSYADTVDIDTFLTSRKDSDNGSAPTPQIARLKGLRLATSSETEVGRTFNAATLKWLTGQDTLTGRMLHANPISFKPSHKIFFSSNYEPALKDVNDRGFKRRLVIIPFTATFSEEKGNLDRNLASKLKTPAMLEDVLTWLVEGWTLYQREGVKPSAEMRRAVNAYYEENDTIGDFLAMYCEMGENYSIRRKELYDDFRQWYSNECGQFVMSPKTFNAIIKGRGFKVYRNHGGERFFLGIRRKDIPTI